MHVGPMGFFDGKANYDIDWDTLDEAGRERRAIRQPRRLARLHRQILAGRARPCRQRADRPRASAARRAAPTRPIMRRSRRSSRRARRSPPKPACSPAPRKRRWLDRYEQAGIPKLSQVDRLGLVRMVHAADFRPADLAVQAHSAISAWRSSALTLIVRRTDVPDRPQAVQVDGRRCARSSRR